MESHRDLIDRWRVLLTDLHNEEINDLSIISVAIRELFDLVRACQQSERN